MKLWRLEGQTDRFCPLPPGQRRVQYIGSLSCISETGGGIFSPGSRRCGRFLFMRTIKFCALAVLAAPLWLALVKADGAEMKIPAFTAYSDPLPEKVRISKRSGISGWNDPAVKVMWFGELRQTGSVECAVSLKLPASGESKLRLTVGGVSREATARGEVNAEATVSFGSFDIARPGYQKFLLETLNPKGTQAGTITDLGLKGSVVENAHFNLKPRRNAASVHLGYPVPEGMKVEAFYCEVTAVEEPVTTFYMACGWHRGYFGMQVNSETERRIIFSVWDSGNEAVDRDKVASTNRVTLVAKGEGVYSGDFGNEGTGGHSHLKYVWKTGEKQKFIITAKPVEGVFTIFSGFYWHPDKKEWMLISSWKAPKEGGYLRGLHSFSENFWGDNGHLRRKALYGNQWIRTSEGQWIELKEARFTHDPTGNEDRLDRFTGVEGGQFFLSHGGFVEGFTKYGDRITRLAGGRSPAESIKLPELPTGKQGVHM